MVCRARFGGRTRHFSDYPLAKGIHMIFVRPDSASQRMARTAVGGFAEFSPKHVPALFDYSMEMGRESVLADHWHVHAGLDQVHRRAVTQHMRGHFLRHQARAGAAAAVTMARRSRYRRHREPTSGRECWGTGRCCMVAEFAKPRPKHPDGLRLEGHDIMPVSA
jgi:hypothetical protein